MKHIWSSANQVLVPLRRLRLRELQRPSDRRQGAAGDGRQVHRQPALQAAEVQLAGAVRYDGSAVSATCTCNQQFEIAKDVVMRACHLHLSTSAARHGLVLMLRLPYCRRGAPSRGRARGAGAEVAAAAGGCITNDAICRRRLASTAVFASCLSSSIPARWSCTLEYWMSAQLESLQNPVELAGHPVAITSACRHSLAQHAEHMHNCISQRRGCCLRRELRLIHLHMRLM